MKIPAILAVVLILIAGIIGYMIGTGGSEIKKADLTSGNISEAINSKVQIEKPKIEVVTLAEQNDSGEAGVAVITEEDGKVKVNINMAGTPQNSKHPAHIHAGQCPTPGAIVYGLNDVVDGKSQTTLEASWDDLNSKLPLAINAHESATNIQKYTACGNISD